MSTRPTSCDVSPGPTAPILTGVLADFHCSRVVTPLAFVSAHAALSRMGTPTYLNLRASNSMPSRPRSWPTTWLPWKFTIVRPSGRATLYVWLAASRLTAPVMFSTMMVGFPGMCRLM
ncbi:MAG: hypothetical protein AUI04_07515 [Candidatus Rokubacteria bacterium 13_2_20CM_2_64_8]|nr:MAG: hypothetical protein AUI04_07515 [Candidatus Rokubacteria bacterium 13_2_20CM_2_64_8]